jgi:hypothetical protein
MRIFLVAITLISLTVQAELVYDARDFGALADGRTDNAKSIQAAIDSCTAKGGGRVLLTGGGIFMSGPFRLKSNVQFFVDAGTTLLANPDESVYQLSAFRENLGEGMQWISAEHVQNISFAGLGNIDGNGIAFMGQELADSYELKPFTIKDPRPHVLTIVDGTNIRIRDLHIGNSAYWTIHLVGCNDVVIDGITLLNSLKVRNSDGIDVDHSRNVRISNCYIESGDDCICLKNRREYEEYGSCENITVTNCTMTSRSCAIKIGSENMDTIRQVVVDNCIIKNSNRGIGIQNRDEGVVMDVTFSNMIVESRLFSDVWWGKAEPIYITAFRRAPINHKDANWRFPKGAKEGRVGMVKNIRFSNINCIGENGVFVSAESSDKISHIYFDQVDVLIDKTTAIPGGIYDRRPAQVDGFVTGSTSGFYFDNATNIVVRNSSVQWGANLPDYFKHAIEGYRTMPLMITNFNGQSANSKKHKAIIRKP